MTSTSLVRRIACCVALLFLVGAIAEARGGGAGGMSGGRRGGKGKGSRASAQAQTIVNNAVRRDNLRRSRHLDW